jgi:peptidoglycan/LPS O-acetylase OafA/YrhL
VDSATQSLPLEIPRHAELYDERFEMLDAWRGVAALAVVLSHGILVTAVGTIAVLIFFVISGYCITAAAESCRRKNLGFRAFMWRRVRRIYSPYLLAVLFFIVTRLIKLALMGQNQLDRPVLVYVQNFTLTQWMTLLFQPISNAFDNKTLFLAAFWSLNYEEQFYLLMGLLLLLGTTRKFGFGAPLVLLLPVALGWNVIFPNISYGFFIEYWAHFAIGAILFYRLCRITTRLSRHLIDGGLAVLLVCSGWLAWQQGALSTPDRCAPFELAVVSGFALLLIALRPLSEPFRATVPGLILSRLGLISYSLYLIQQANYTLVTTVTNKLLPAGAPFLLNAVTQVSLHIMLATVFWRFCERPFLNKSTSRAPAPAPAPAPVPAPAPAVVPSRAVPVGSVKAASNGDPAVAFKRRQPTLLRKSATVAASRVRHRFGGLPDQATAALLDAVGPGRDASSAQT